MVRARLGKKLEIDAAHAVVCANDDVRAPDAQPEDQEAPSCVRPEASVTLLAGAWSAQRVVARRGRWLRRLLSQSIRIEDGRAQFAQAGARGED